MFKYSLCIILNISLMAKCGSIAVQKGRQYISFLRPMGLPLACFRFKRRSPDLDFKVKILLPNPESVPYLLPHDEWVVDLLIKAQHYKGEIIGLLNFLSPFL